MNNRNLKIEWLRVFFMAIIVLLHMLTFGYGYKASSTPFVSDGFEGHTVPSLLAVSRLGVTGFIFISGFYGVRLKINRMVSLWTATCFYSIVSTFCLFSYKEINLLKELIDAPFSIFDSWWFIQSYIIIMLISPFIEEGIKNITKKQFTYITLFLFVMQYVVQFYHVAYNGPSFLRFFIVYIIARYCASYPIFFFKQYSLKILIISGLLLIFMPFYVCYVGFPNMLKWINSNYNPIYIIVVYSLILYASERPIYGTSSFFTSNILAVYLLHSSKFGNYFLWESGLFSYHSFSLVKVLVFVICIYVFCVLVEQLRKKIFLSFDKKIVEYIKNVI